MSVIKAILVLLLAGFLAFGLAACGDDGDADESDTAGVIVESGETPPDEETEAPADDEQEAEARAAAEKEAKRLERAAESAGPARSEQIDALLRMHPIFTVKRFMNFAARGDVGACQLLSAKGRRLMGAAHGQPCPATIRAAAAAHDRPGLVVYGEFVPVEEFSDLDYRATIYVLERELGRIAIDDKRPPFKLSRDDASVWLIDAVPLTEIGAGD